MKKIIDRIKRGANGFSGNIANKIENAKQDRKQLTRKEKAIKYTKAVILTLVFALAFVELVFTVSIFVFKTEDNISKRVAKIIPLPAVYTNAGSVTIDQYFIEKDYITKFYESTQQGDVNSLDLKKQIINQLVENKLIQAEATKFKVKVSQTELDESMNQIFESNGGKDEVEKVLQELYGLNVSQFQDLVRVQLLRDKINKDVIARVEAKHILIRVEETADQATVDAAKAKIDGILAEIKGGLDFSEVAKKSSEDTGSAENGGTLEAFARGDMVAEFENAAFSTPVGSISEPIRTSFGWHIIKVESKTGTIEMSFDEWLSLIKEKSLILRLVRL